MKGGRSDPRNVILHQMFSYLGYGERAGSGLYMISTVWEDKNWIKPEMEEELNPNRTILTLYMRKNNNYPNNYPIPLSNMQQEILNIIIEKPNATQSDIAKKLEISRQSVATNIKELKDNNVITRIGANKKGYWKIL